MTLTWRWYMVGFALLLAGAGLYVAFVLLHLVHVMDITVSRGDELADDMDAIVTRLSLILTPKEPRGNPPRTNL